MRSAGLTGGKGGMGEVEPGLRGADFQTLLQKCGRFSKGTLVHGNTGTAKKSTRNELQLNADHMHHTAMRIMVTSPRWANEAPRSDQRLHLLFTVLQRGCGCDVDSVSPSLCPALPSTPRHFHSTHTTNQWVQQRLKSNSIVSYSSYCG